MGEKDQVKWLGVRPTDPEEILTRFEPPYDCTYINVYNSADNGTTVLYTVPASTLFYLTDIIGNIRSSAAGEGRIYVRDTGDVFLYPLLWIGALIGDGKFCCHSFNTALQIPAGYDIILTSNAANCTMYGSITGYTRPV